MTKKSLAWKSDNVLMAALVASVLSQPVADLVLMYSDAKDSWDMLVDMNKAIFND